MRHLFLLLAFLLANAFAAFAQPNLKKEDINSQAFREEFCDKYAELLKDFEFNFANLKIVLPKDDVLGAEGICDSKVILPRATNAVFWPNKYEKGFFTYEAYYYTGYSKEDAMSDYENLVKLISQCTDDKYRLERYSNLTPQTETIWYGDEYNYDDLVEDGISGIYTNLYIEVYVKKTSDVALGDVYSVDLRIMFLPEF